MSFILDALKKSQADRDANTASDDPAAAPEGEVGEEAEKKARIKRLAIIGGSGLLAIALLVGGLKFFLGTKEPAPQIAGQPQEQTDEAAGLAEEGPTEKADDTTGPAESPAPEPETEAVTEGEAPAEPPAAPDPMRPPTLVAMPSPTPEEEPDEDASAAAMAEAEPKPEPEPEPEPEAEPAAPVVKAEPVRKPEAPVRQAASSGTEEEWVEASLASVSDADLVQARSLEEQGLFEQAAAAYSRAIRRSPRAAEGYLGRGWSYLELGRLDQAVGDFTRAINRAPGLADGYLGRAWAYERKGSLSLAAGDYGELLRLDPANAHAAISRGIIGFQQGRFTAAARDFDRVVQGGDPGLAAFALIWRHVSQLRTGGDGAADLAVAAANIDLAAWPGPLATHFMGRGGEDRIMAAVEKAVTRQERLKRACVAHFFLGEAALAGGDAKRAEEHFRAAVDTGVVGYRQYWVAKAELDKLGSER